jgi:hypothetical protein
MICSIEANFDTIILLLIRGWILQFGFSLSRFPSDSEYLSHVIQKNEEKTLILTMAPKNFFWLYALQRTDFDDWYGRYVGKKHFCFQCHENRFT